MMTQFYIVLISNVTNVLLNNFCPTENKDIKNNKLSKERKLQIFG